VQDVVAGDGTTSVVVICGALLKKAQELLEKGIHPTVISDSFNKAANKACEVHKAPPPPETLHFESQSGTVIVACC
jgi:T-complex protein 1 subunit delta